MKSKPEIKPLNNSHKNAILELILHIQQIEFNVPVTLEDQPDLLDIESFYIHTGGGFWGAFIDEELVGTIALISIADHHAGAIRKMFVKKEYRGKEMGIASKLLQELIGYCKIRQMDTLMLGTVDMLKAAHRFYEKNGFVRQLSEDMPEYFPRMNGENVYYRLRL